MAFTARQSEIVRLLDEIIIPGQFVMPRSSLDGPSYAQSQDRSWIGAAMDYCLVEIAWMSRKRKPLTRKSKYVIVIARESQLAMGLAKVNNTICMRTVCHAPGLPGSKLWWRRHDERPSRRPQGVSQHSE